MRSLTRLLLLVLLVPAPAAAAEQKVVADAKAMAEWIALALGTSGYKADFSLDSLTEIDRFFDEHSRRGKPVRRGLLSEQMGARLFAIGGYVGEVIRRHAGGRWVGDDADPLGEINISLQLPGGAVIWPVQRVMNRMKNGREDSIHPYAVVIVGDSGRRR